MLDVDAGRLKPLLLPFLVLGRKYGGVEQRERAGQGGAKKRVQSSDVGRGRTS